MLSKVTIKNITAGGAYKYEGSSLPAFALNFGTILNNATYICENLDESEIEYVAGVKLSEGEKIFRSHTERSLLRGLKYLIKINLNKGLVYYLTEEAYIIDKPIFEKKGVQLTFVNIKNF